MMTRPMRREKQKDLQTLTDKFCPSARLQPMFKKKIGAKKEHDAHAIIVFPTFVCRDSRG